MTLYLTHLGLGSNKEHTCDKGPAFLWINLTMGGHFNDRVGGGFNENNQSNVSICKLYTHRPEETT